MFQKLYNSFSNNIGIDLGTANTLVYMQGEGVIINEPSVVAINQKTDQIVAIGTQAKEMLGRTPTHIRAVRPLVDGVVSDFEVTEELLSYLISKTEQVSKKFFKPRLVIGVPSGITNVETRAVYDAAKNAGAREVYIVEEPIAAAIGVGLPVFEPVGSMLIDIGGGNTDVAVIALGGIVQSKNIAIAGDTFNANIMTHFREEFKLSIGEKTAEKVKIELGSVVPLEQPKESIVRGRDLTSGLPREVVVTDTDIREAISASVRVLVEGVREVLENTPPEILSDVMARGIVLTGGGALMVGMDVLIARVAKIPVYVADEALFAVVRGAGMILDNLEYYAPIIISTDGDDVPLR